MRFSMTQKPATGPATRVPVPQFQQIKHTISSCSEAIGIIRLRVATSLIALLSTSVSAQADDKLWDNPNGGFFSTTSNWFGGIPGSNDVARFGITDSSFFQRAYTVTFLNNATNQQLIVEDDNVTFDLTTRTYTATNSFVPLALGTVAG